MKLVLVAVISLVIGFFAANLLYPQASGRVTLAMAVLLFAFLSALIEPKHHRS